MSLEEIIQELNDLPADDVGAAPDAPPEPPVPAEEPVAPEPPASAAPSELEELRTQMREMQDERRELMRLLAERSAPQTAQQPVKPDINSIIDQHFEGASARALREVVSALEGRFASKDEFTQTQRAAVDAQVTMEEQRAEAKLAKMGYTQNDITEAHRRIQDTIRRGEGGWRSAEAAYKEQLADILAERQFKQADAAAQRAAAVTQRAQRTATPSSAAPAGGKVQLDVRKFREQFKEENGRYPDVSEVADWSATAG